MIFPRAIVPVARVARVTPSVAARPAAIPAVRFYSVSQSLKKVHEVL